MNLLRLTIRKLILENKAAFEKELSGMKDWDEGSDDSAMDDEEERVIRARKRGRPLKQVWSKHVNRDWVQSLTYVHWVDHDLLFDFMEGCQVDGVSKDELSCIAYLDPSKINVFDDYGPFGFVIEGHVSLLGQNMDKMYTGFREEYYGLPHGEQMENSSGMAKGVRVANSGTYILDKEDFVDGRNEALLDNWKAVALVYPRKEKALANQTIENWEAWGCGQLRGIEI